MKRAVKIIISVVLCASVCISLTACLKMPFGISVFSKGNTTVDGTIAKIDIDWPAGQVVVTGSGQSGTEITLLEGEEESLLYRQLGSSLFIKCGEGAAEGSTLVVRIPRDSELDEIEIRTEDAGILATDISAESLDFASVSGSIVTHDCRISGTVELQTESGGADVTADAPEYDIVTESGEMSVTCLSVPEETECDFDGGVINLYLPSDAGFTVHGDGEININGFAAREKSGSMVCGDGEAEIDVSTKDGILNIISQ